MEDCNTPVEDYNTTVQDYDTRIATQQWRIMTQQWGITTQQWRISTQHHSRHHCLDFIPRRWYILAHYAISLFSFMCFAFLCLLLFKLSPPHYHKGSPDEQKNSLRDQLFKSVNFNKCKIGSNPQKQILPYRVENDWCTEYRAY